jgi:hypothetical protein
MQSEKFSFRRLWQRFSRRASGSSNKSETQTTASSPPPYPGSHRDTTNARYSTITTEYYLLKRESTSQPDITRKSTPQWEWTNGDCQFWLYLMLREMCGFSNKDAYAKARSWSGFGPSLYTFSYTKWRTFLGEADGTAIRDYLITKRRCPGAVPCSILLGDDPAHPHYSKYMEYKAKKLGL